MTRRQGPYQRKDLKVLQNRMDVNYSSDKLSLYMFYFMFTSAL